MRNCVPQNWSCTSHTTERVLGATAEARSRMSTNAKTGFASMHPDTYFAGTKHQVWRPPEEQM